MKKILTTVVALFILVAFSFPLVSASSVEGTGQDRTVLFATPEGDANFTVGVPAILNNETLNSFTFVVNETGGADDYLLNVSIGSNGTWYTQSVAVTSVDMDNVTAYVNYSALTLPLNASANITIEVVFDTNYTVVDTWYGEVRIVDANDYSMSVTLISMIINLMTLFVMVSFVMLIFRYLKEAVKPTKGKGKKK